MGAAPNTTLEFTGEQDRLISGLTSNMKLVAIALLVLAPLRLVFGGLDVASHPLAGGLSLVEGVLTGLLGLVMLKAATDARYMVETKGYDKEHLLNAVESLTVFYRVQVGLAVLVVLGMALHLMIGV
jgi:hypothetical protein